MDSCWFRSLQSFYVTSDVGTLMYIFFEMMRDMIDWIVLYGMLLMAMAMLPLGIGEYETLIQHCEQDVDYSAHDSDIKMMCFWGYSFYKTVFQSFGELFLEDIRNETSAFFLIVTFFILNVMLMNLLIAQVKN